MTTKDKYYKAFVEQAPTAIAMLDNNMHYIAVSEQWVKDYKMEGQQIVGRSHYDIFPEIGDAWKAKHKEGLAGAIDICDEAPFIRADGSVQWIYWDVRPWYDAEGEIGGLVMQTGDITHLKEKEDERRRIEKILDRTNDVARIGTWDVDLLRDTIFWSKMVREIHEVPENYEPTLSAALSFYKEGKSFETIKKAVDDAVKYGTSYDIEVELVTFKGNDIWTRAIGQSEFVDGKCVRLFGVFQDITEIKNSQRELNKAHTQLQAIFNSGIISIVSSDLNGIINHFNHGAEILTGYSASEMVGLNRPSMFCFEEVEGKFKADIAKLYGKDPKDLIPLRELAEHDAYDTRDWIFRRKDGSILPVQLTLTGVKNEQGEIIGYLGVATDVSERRITQNELLRKNHLLNFAEEISLMGHWQWDIIADKVQWSNNLYQIFGVDENKSDLTFGTYFSFVHPDDKGMVKDFFKNTIADKKFNRFTHRISTNGKIKTVQLRGEVISNDKGETVELLGTCQDVTEQTMAENKFRGLLESAPDAMVIVNENEEIQLINKQAEILFGYSAKELFEKPVGILIPERFGRTKSGIQIMGEGNETYGVNKMGKKIPVQISFSPLHTDEGLLVSAAIRDVTVQKLAKNELLRKNQQLTFAEKITSMGNWQWDLVTGKVIWSANLYNIFGLQEDYEVSSGTYFSFVHPDDREWADAYLVSAREDHSPMDIVHRILLSDGTVKTVHILSDVIVDSSGKIIEMIGTCQDVTEQKMAENKFRGLLESAPDAMVIVNEEGKIQLINKQAEKLFGYQLDELFDKSVEELIPSRFAGEHSMLRNEFFSNPRVMGAGKARELFGKNKDGLEIPIQVSLSPLQTEEGILVSAAIRDITDQKLSERKIIEAKERLEMFANQLTIQNTQLADFAHITSHNLRAPVSNLNSLLDFYKQSESEEDKADLFQKFEKVVNHLTGTLHTLVEVLATKDDKPEDLEDVDFEEVLTLTKEILYSQITNTGAVITSDFSKINKINYKRIYLDSIFLNLLSNAIKYKSDARIPEIHIESEIVDGKISVQFTDNGLGIDLEKNGHKLFGLNKVFHRHPEAKGVGLFMTKAQVESMGGEISATSKVDKGSTFRINFN